MVRHFNTAGPCLAKDHYLLDPFSRIDWSNVESLIDAKKFFVLHAPRQSGKTTLLQAIVDRLNLEGRYLALRFSVQAAQAARDDFSRGDELIASELVRSAG